MKKFIRQGLMASAVAATGVVAAASGAFAQAAPAEATVNFTGTVGSVCIFSNMVPGVLVQDGPNFLDSGDPFGGGAPGSSLGSVDLECTGGAEISISAPQDNGSTTDLLADPSSGYETFAQVGSTAGTGPATDASNSSSFGSSVGFIPGAFNENVAVGMRIDGPFIPEGAYNYNVTVTAIPN